MSLLDLIPGWKAAKTYVMIGGIAAIALAIAGGVAYHFITVSGLQKETAALHQTISTQRETLIVNQNDIKREKEANDTLLAAHTRAVEDIATYNAEMKRVADLTAQLQTEMGTFAAKLSDPRRIEREEALLSKDRSANRLLGVYNAQVQCQSLHFAARDGSCVAGRWVPAKRVR